MGRRWSALLGIFLALALIEVVVYFKLLSYMVDDNDALVIALMAVTLTTAFGLSVSIPRRDEDDS